METSQKKYTINDAKKDFVAGGSSGVMLGFCWGLVNGAYVSYDPNLPFKTFSKRWLGFTAKSTIAFMPMIGASSVLYKLCKAADLGETGSLLVTIAVTAFMFDAGKRIIYRIK